MKDQPPQRARPGKSLPSRPHAPSGSGIFLLILGFMPLAAVAQAMRNADPSGVPDTVLGPTLVAIIAVITLNSVFVAAGTAIELLRQGHLRQVERDDVRSGRIVVLMADKPRFIAGCTLGSQTMRAWMMLLCFVPAPAFATWLVERALVSEGYPGVLIAGVIITIPVAAVNLVFGELVPKSYAAIHPMRTAANLFRFVQAFTVVFSVPSRILTEMADIIAKRFGGRATFALPNQAEEEIKNLVESAQETGEIEAEERELIHSVFEFTDTVAREVMTPRVDLDAVNIDTDPSDIIRVIQESGHSRIPVFEDTDDQIIGIIHAKDLLTARLKGDLPLNLRTLLRPALFVPENKDLYDLLRDLRLSRSQMAIVQDEFGGTAGIVTIEDIVEELVGDIVDEYDVETPDITPDGIGFHVNGKTNLDDLNGEVGSNFDSEEFDTVAGFVFGLFGRQPKVGEYITDGDYRFCVVESDGRRITRLRLERIDDTLDDNPVNA